ncbi:STAS domain-containing protein [Eleftheria terrae]|uniref:STAS domain-containing protein n=1 Tax=Eleftheria terrae TaxID=1597781 RepID=UPI00263B099E|nr:STAS domain-containing protein [Eleftheria terrae]WKB52639.1 STAS domain-containing protein [Eleftheria terrae]
MKSQNQSIDACLKTEPERFLSEWIAEFLANQSAGAAVGQTASADASRVLEAFAIGIAADGEPGRFNAAPWAPLRERLATLSRSRAAQGSSAGDTSLLVLAMKKPLFNRLQQRHQQDPAVLAEMLWWASTLVDKMAQFTVDTYQTSREDIIKRQQEELLELSTPVVKLWDGVLAVPMIGTLDSSRTQVVMESLLQRIVETSSELAIIDITGVPTVDTLVAQHLLKTVTAIRLMGADCIVSGIRPQIAQTIVHLGIDLQGITTKSTLADALALALKRTGHTVTRDAA